MAALGIDAELGLVDRGEGEIALKIAVVMRVAARHGHAFGGAQEIACLGGTIRSSPVSSATCFSPLMATTRS